MPRRHRALPFEASVGRTIHNIVTICQEATCESTGSSAILGGRMRKRDHSPALCARFHRASELIGRRWTGAIIFVLLKRHCRFATLRDAIPDITDRMLSDRLQEL